MVRVTLPPGSMLMKALGVKPAPGPAALPTGARTPTSRPPPAIAPTCSRARREVWKPASRSLGFSTSWNSRIACPLGGFRRGFDRLADAHIGAAPADVPGHGGVDVGVVGVGDGVQQRRGRHDLAGLAV